jgi:adenylate kinase
MPKRVVLITGTPGVGKTTLALRVADELSAQYVDLTELARSAHLTVSEDKARDTLVIDEGKMRRKLRAIIEQSPRDTVVDGHYAAAITPKRLVTHVFVLRRNPKDLRSFLQKRGYSEAKQQENLEAEVLDVCLVEALQKQDAAKVCEIDVTGKTVEETLSSVLAVLEGKAPCIHGVVDWMGLLEREGKLDLYLKP